jgi:hypothetical protein
MSLNLLESGIMPSTAWTFAVLAGVSLLYAILFASINHFSRQSQFLRGQPAVGRKGQTTWLSKYCAGVASLFHSREMILEGYYKFSRKNQIFDLPQLGGAPWAMLPQTNIHELPQKGDNEIDHRPVIFDIVAMYRTGDSDITSVTLP